jgi:poly(3-hydroxybutyrate) depolymerase
VGFSGSTGSASGSYVGTGVEELAACGGTLLMALWLNTDRENTRKVIVEKRDRIFIIDQILFQFDLITQIACRISPK